MSPNYPNASDANQSCSFTLLSHYLGMVDGHMPFLPSTEVELIDHPHGIEWYYGRTFWSAVGWVQVNTTIEWRQSSIEEEDQGWRVCASYCSAWPPEGGVTIYDPMPLWEFFALLALATLAGVCAVCLVCNCCFICCRNARRRKKVRKASEASVVEHQERMAGEV